MTRGKARAKSFKAFAARLTYIWLPGAMEGKKVKWTVDQRRIFRFEACIAPQTRFEFSGNPPGSGYTAFTLTYTENRNTDAERASQLGCIENEGLIEAMEMTRARLETGAWSSDGEHSEHLKQFTAQWLPFFRRGCWLSGYPIEASAHEKAEWIQGFSREEIQAWNLKL